MPRSERHSTAGTSGFVHDVSIPAIPVFVGSSPLSKDLKAIRRLLAAGAEGVVTKTICIDPDPTPCKAEWIGDNLFNSDGYSDKSLDYWAEALTELRDLPVIANVFAESEQRLAQLCRVVEASGCAGIELGLSCPTKSGDPVCQDSEMLAALCRAGRRAAPNTPMTVKIVWDASRARLKRIAQIAVDAGMDGIVCSDTFRAAIPRRNDPRVLSCGAMSGPAFFYLNLFACLELKAAAPDKAIWFSGGLETAEQLTLIRMHGIDAAQICTTLFRNGVGSIRKIVEQGCLPSKVGP